MTNNPLNGVLAKVTSHLKAKLLNGVLVKATTHFKTLVLVALFLNTLLLVLCASLLISSRSDYGEYETASIEPDWSSIEAKLDEIEYEVSSTQGVVFEIEARLH